MARVLYMYRGTLYRGTGSGPNARSTSNRSHHAGDDSTLHVLPVVRDSCYWRTAYIKAEREKLGNKNARISLKMPITKMTEIVEAATKKFNDGQKESKSIAKTFISAGQDPFSDCEAEFKAHLDSLSKLPVLWLRQP